MLYYIDKSSGSGAHCESDKTVNDRRGENVDFYSCGDKIFKFSKFKNSHSFWKGTPVEMLGINRFRETKVQGYGN